jgi:hypothetical protein
MSDGGTVMPSADPAHGGRTCAVAGSHPLWPALFEDRVRAVTVVVKRKRLRLAEPETSSPHDADAGGEVERKTRVFVVPTERRGVITEPAPGGFAVAPSALLRGTRRRRSALHRPGKVVLIVRRQDSLHPPAADAGPGQGAANDSAPGYRPLGDDWLPPPLTSDYHAVRASLARVLTLVEQAQAASRLRFRR